MTALVQYLIDRLAIFWAAFDPDPDDSHEVRPRLDALEDPSRAPLAESPER